MAEELFTIPQELYGGRPSLPARPAGPLERLMRAIRPPREPALTARWLDANGAQVGDEVPLSTSATTWIEYPDASGRFGHEAVRPPLAFKGEQPLGAVSLELRDRGRSLTRIPDVRLPRAPSRLPTPLKQRVGRDDARLVLPVFSERFADQASFLASVRRLHAWILGRVPFSEPGVGGRFALDTYFWPSEGATGLFNTPDSASQGERLFHGDRSRAKLLLDRFIGQAPTSLILINSTKRGGAGGTPGYSAWSSVAERPDEPWEAVCLHELGHGLGLADEYLDPRRESESPAGEPNVAASGQPLRQPWRDLVNINNGRVPNFTLDNEAHSPDGAVGTFQGARYRRDLYRASRRCLMRDTREDFCAVCCAHIRGVRADDS